MKVKYSIFNNIAYNNMMQTCPEMTKLEDYVTEGTGEIVAFVKGSLFSSHKFIICDDVNKNFVEVNINDCFKIDDNNEKDNIVS